MEYNSKTGISDFTFTIDNATWNIADTGSKTISTPMSTTGNYTNMNSCTISNCGCSGWHYYYPDYGWYWYPQAPVTKYLYQILCPKPDCKGKFWAELDEIKACPKCKSRIKVTDKESDYAVAVTK